MAQLELGADELEHLACHAVVELAVVEQERDAQLGARAEEHDGAALRFFRFSITAIRNIIVARGLTLW